MNTNPDRSRLFLAVDPQKREVRLSYRQWRCWGLFFIGGGAVLATYAIAFVQNWWGF